MHMPRIGLIGAAALGLLTAAASPEEPFDCHKAYKEFWERLREQPTAVSTAEQHVAITRKALRIYDACLTRDVHDPKALFDRLGRRE